MSDKIKVGVFYNNYTKSQLLVETLEDRGFEVIEVNKFSQLFPLKVREQVFDIDVGIVHMDFNVFGPVGNEVQGVKTEDIIRLWPESCRRIVVGKQGGTASQQAIELQADSHWAFEEVFGLPNLSRRRPLISEVKKGRVGIEELGLRGKSVLLEGFSRIEKQLNPAKTRDEYDEDQENIGRLRKEAGYK